jgi:hypothetical protein
MRNTTSGKNIFDIQVDIVEISFNFVFIQNKKDFFVRCYFTTRETNGFKAR